MGTSTRIDQLSPLEQPRGPDDARLCCLTRLPHHSHLHHLVKQDLSSADQRCGTSCRAAHFARPVHLLRSACGNLRWSQAAEQEEEADGNLEEHQRHVSPRQVRKLREIGEEEENGGAGGTPCTRQDAEGGQRTWHAGPLEPQLCNGGGRQGPEYQADAILIEARKTLACQHWELVWRDYARVLGAAQEPQGGKEIDRSREPDEAMGQTAEGGERREGLVHWPEMT